MIKIYCDVCSKEIEVEKFTCDMQVTELKDGKAVQNVVQVCQKCYDKKFAPLMKK